MEGFHTTKRDRERVKGLPHNREINCRMPSHIGELRRDGGERWRERWRWREGERERERKRDTEKESKTTQKEIV
jgi:hypothetical protein